MQRVDAAVLTTLDRLSSLRGVVLGFVVYGLAHAAASFAFGPALALDDAKLNVLTQSWRGGYLPTNPPLYEWLLNGVQIATGPTLASFLALKYALMTITGALAYALAREAGGDRRSAALTAFALTMTFQLGWNYHQAFTHTLALIPATLGFWLALLRAMRRRGLVDFVILGVAVGLGALAKYAFLGAAGAALAAAAWRPAGRAALATPKAAATVLVAALVMAPHLCWIVTENADVAARLVDQVGAPSAPSLGAVAAGVSGAVWAYGSFFLPAAALVVLKRKGAFYLLPSARVLRDAGAFGFVGLIAAAPFLGAVQERYAIAFALPLFIVLAMGAFSSMTPAGVARAGLAILAVAVAVVGVRIIQAAAPYPFCTGCGPWTPYASLARGLADAGFRGGAIVGYTDEIAGNMRRYFPEARVLSSHLPDYVPPGGAPTEACWFVWAQGAPDAPAPALQSMFDPARTFDIAADWRRDVFGGEARRTVWRAVALDGDPSLGRAFCRSSRDTAEYHP